VRPSCPVQLGQAPEVPSTTDTEWHMDSAVLRTYDFGMEWDTIIPALFALVGAALGAVLGAASAGKRRDEFEVRRQQIDTLVEVLEIADRVYGQILDIYVGRIQRADLDWVPWRAAVRRSTIFHPSILAHAVLHLDRECYVFYRGTKFVRGPIPIQIVREIEVPWVQARDALLTAARQSFGHQDALPPSGMPARGDAVWAESFWTERLGVAEPGRAPRSAE
jgi:hypothetical protein